MKKIFCQIFGLLMVVVCIAQNNQLQLPILSRIEMQEDFELFRQQLEKYHTGLYENTSKSKFDQIFISTKNALNKPKNVLEFYQTLSGLNPHIGNGHTVIQLPTPMLDSMIERASFFPLAVVYLQKKLYVLRNNSEDSTIAVGSQILTINDKSSTQIIDEMVQHFNRDGQNTTGPTRDALRSFNLNYYLYVETVDSFVLKIQHPSSTIQHCKIAALPVSKIRKNRIERYGKRTKKLVNQKALSLEFIEDAAVLTIKSFNRDVIKRGQQHYKKFLKKAFAEIAEKNVQKLILDLRENGGGDDGKGPLLYSYLAKEEFIYGKEVLANTKKIDNPKDFEKPGLVRMYNFIRFFTDRKSTDNTVRVPKNKSFGTFSPKTNAFSGDLLVLMDAGCFSAAGEFLGCVRHYHRGTFIGEEAAGSAGKNTSGIMLWFTLPHSKVRILLPLYQYAMAYEEFYPMICVQPDIKVTPTFEEYIEGKDLIMERALKY